MVNWCSGYSHRPVIWPSGHWDRMGQAIDRPETESSAVLLYRSYCQTTQQVQNTTTISLHRWTILHCVYVLHKSQNMLTVCFQNGRKNLIYNHILLDMIISLREAHLCCFITTVIVFTCWISWECMMSSHSGLRCLLHPWCTKTGLSAHFLLLWAHCVNLADLTNVFPPF